MINPDNFSLTFGVILIVLVTVTVISYSGKFIFVADKLKKPTNLLFDPDHGLNISHICNMAKSEHTIVYEKSSCFNKTLLQWYNPWLRHSLWNEFWREIKAKNRLKRMKNIQVKTNQTILIPNDKVFPTDISTEKKDTKVQKGQGKEKSVEFFYSILFGLLILSGVIAFWEVCKDKLKRNAAATAKAQEHQSSLADFTISRHLRRESHEHTISHFARQGPLEMTAKVTQNLIHQSSLDRAFPKTISEAVASLDSRRNSMPSHLNTDIPITGTPFSPVLKLSKRQSVDVSGEDISLDIKKKSRFFIRRH